MPAPKRQRVLPTDDWQQLELLMDWPELVHERSLHPVSR